MATTSIVALAPATSTRPQKQTDPAHWHSLTWHIVLALLALAMLLIQGYHPYSEDGGVYVAGIEYLIDPALFPHYTAFVTAHLHYSVFAYGLAAVVRLVHLPLPCVLFVGYVFSLWLTLFASRCILQRCNLSPLAQFAGTALLAVWATLPVAGTSLVLIDPYLTARSLSTPLSLLAIAFALDTWFKPPADTLNPKNPARHTRFTRSLAACLLCLLAAAALHPLMAVYGAALVISLCVARLGSWLRTGSVLAGVAVLLTAIINALAPAESPAVMQTAISRYYWFLSQWHWYELCGLVGPLSILLLLLLWKQSSEAILRLARACLLAGCTSVLSALLFAHRDAPTHLVARLQPLRVFLLIYAIMAVLLAATLMQKLLTTSATTRICSLTLGSLLLLNAAALFYAQRSTYPGSQHLELPWLQPTNPWSQAFTWARKNTPKQALFALDANYITQSHEDAQTFRATSQRSALPDFSKDGGEASITPSLANLWQQGVDAQTNLSQLDDATRDARMQSLNVTWMVLRTSAVTQHPCPYRNSTVKVCRLAP